MTVAIAAIEPSRRYIISVSDTRLSFNNLMMARDGVLKARRVAKNWGLMFSALNTDVFLPVLGNVQHYTKYKEGDQPTISYQQMREVVVKAYHDEFDRQFSELHLYPWGYKTINEFRKMGRSEITDKKYDEVLDKQSRFDIGLQLLVYGFNRGGDPHLFEVRNPGIVDVKDLHDYAAIGSGALMAWAELNRRPMGTDLATTIYNCLGAKFAAEHADGVGQDTAVTIMGAEGAMRWVNDEAIDKLRVIWRRELTRPEPEDAMELLRNAEGFTNAE